MEKSQEENRQDFKAILDAGGPRGAVAQEVIRAMTSYFNLCAELNEKEKSVASGLMAGSIAATRAHAEELEGLVGRLYQIVMNWNKLQAETIVHIVNVLRGETTPSIPGAEAAR